MVHPNKTYTTLSERFIGFLGRVADGFGEGETKNITVPTSDPSTESHLGVGSIADSNAELQAAARAEAHSPDALIRR